MGRTVQQIPAAYSATIDAIAAERQLSYRFRLKDSVAGQKILSASAEERRLFVIAMLQWLQNGGSLSRGSQISKFVDALLKVLYSGSASQKDESFRRKQNVIYAMLDLLGRKLPLDHSDVVMLLAWSGDQEYARWAGAPQVIRVLENYLRDHPLTTEIQQELQRIVTKLESGYNTAEMRKWVLRLRELGGLKDVSLPIVEGEVWSDAAIHDLEAMEAGIRSVWVELLNLCASERRSEPGREWLERTQVLLDKIGFDAFKQAVLKWFPLVDRPRTNPMRIRCARDLMTPDLIHERNADLLKGMIWLCTRKEDTELARTLAALAVSTYRRIRGMGPRCVKVGNACIWALGQMPGLEGVRQLVVLGAKLKCATAQREIEKAISVTAERVGLPRDEIEEMTAPTYGMEPIGVRRTRLGEFTAEFAVTGTASTGLRWIKPNGKHQRAIPKVIKENHPAELRELKQAIHDIEKMIPAQRDRIESLYLRRKTWDYATWRARYLDHPLVGVLARRLIWQFSEGNRAESGIWYDGQIVAYDGYPLAWLSESTQVTLWHPIHESPNTVIGWRNWLLEYMVQQPFKQAHREVYLLTDAERHTRVYSNRFAAHIVKQHQFNALCNARGWKNRLRLMVDDIYPPATRLIPSYGLRAEFWVESVGVTYGTDTTEAGTYLYLTTDQVRFYPIDAAENLTHASGGRYYSSHDGQRSSSEPIPLAEIPPLVFTEVMRDIDLFVSVAAVGNDPNWSDGGPEGRYRNYWERYSFGDLSEVAKTRKQILERLIPRLKIADRCKITDKFLVVQGDIRTYKIHLGSGNVLMMPNDQYLCIVPAQGGANENLAAKIFLPFEGDHTLALILSKAFMLADDTQIKDPTIVRQIRNG